MLDIMVCLRYSWRFIVLYSAHGMVQGVNERKQMKRADTESTRNKAALREHQNPKL